MAGLLGIATSGLSSIQQALSTAGHNIANVNTEGYSRQIAEFQTLPSQRMGGQYIGSGVEVGDIRRAYDSFVVDELRTRTSKLGFAASFESLSASLDKLAGDGDNGLSPALQGFFDAVQDVASDPGSLSARQILLADAQVLTDRFSQLSNSLSGFERETNSKIRSAVSEINGMVVNIAKLNSDITLALGNGGQPNDLLDQRDRLLAELSSKVGISTLKQSDGSINVFAGKGQSLVIGGESSQLVVTDNPLYPGRLEVGVTRAGGQVSIISDQLKDGALKGAIDFRTRVLDPAISELGRLALGITELFNAQHRLGVDLNGQLGGDFFSPISSVTIPSGSNIGTAAVSFTIDDVTQLEASDYRMLYNGSAWEITRTSDGSITSGAGPTFTLDGISISVAGAPVPGPSAGDNFLLRPVYGAAEQFGLKLSSAVQFAAGTPVLSDLAFTNSGSADINELRVNSTTGLPLAGPITLTYDSSAGGYTGGPTGTLAFNPATESGGKSFTLTGFGDLSFTLSGIPRDGDVITLEPGTGAPGDNRNALLLGAMQSERLLGGGSATFGESYSGMIGGIGVATRQARANLQAESSLMDNAIATRDSISGVNLEQEAAELVRLQQAYQAAAQLVAITDTLFQTLLGATRR